MKNETELEAQILFGKKLRVERKIVRNETREEYAQATGLGEKHIEKIENGERGVLFFTLLKLRYAGLDVNQIMDEITQELEKEGKRIIEDYR